jgi:hypothetical protein
MLTVSKATGEFNGLKRKKKESNGDHSKGSVHFMIQNASVTISVPLSK